MSSGVTSLGTEGNANYVKLLIEHGADVTTRDGSHRTPLHLASSWDDIYGQYLKPYKNYIKAEIVQLLIEHGADVSVGGYDPLDAFASGGALWQS
ncbi:hypothetical protein EDB87DRAFT_1687340 [Lactarius vividus]|nr:hypothetical protein EDB87DRAFT_1687340 [Lactarius vividus]